MADGDGVCVRMKERGLRALLDIRDEKVARVYVILQVDAGRGAG